MTLLPLQTIAGTIHRKIMVDKIRHVRPGDGTDKINPENGLDKNNRHQ